MTLGEKLKKARKQNGFSQEQLSEKIGVSRSAVAKWETDKGIPDVENLKIISRLLGVSVDHLINDHTDYSISVLREPIDLKTYGKGKKQEIKNKIVREKFPKAEITPLIGKQKLTKSERVIDNIVGLFTDAPYGIPEVLNSFKNADKAFYLVEYSDKQFFVTVTDVAIESRELSEPFVNDEIEYDNMKFIKCKYKL